MDVRALLFDVFGTVVDWRGGVVREVRRLAPGVDAEAFADDWDRRYGAATDRVRRRERAFVGLDTLLRESLDALLADAGAGGTDAPTRAELVRAWRRLDPWPDSVAGLTRLREHHVLATLSNGTLGQLVDMARFGRLPWDAVLTADVFEHYKPDAAVYDGALRLLGLPAEQVMLVAAHGYDLAGARARGLRTAYLHRPDEHGSGGPVVPRTDPAADLNVASLTELADRLG